ncbi:glutathione S-transferase family protein [Rhizobium sp. S95]|uniref:Glutathione S-transferase family protein n=1 Tax=Ciceribacter sichuanensis TaxID=2949647 RepID=A0AAJ1F581_9HYPH|nr:MULTISPECIES: glutathione S-transferase family protein [unclassified Ciceribacter]MCM2396379.1 glutathione S-transferase family protein [Ciceribacter sp. S95]MCO5957470.1 glutathione S-transferase family protein [Ciceribacter sp. S101]
MEGLVLYIGNKNYSSWSLRPWIGLTAAGIPFEERLIPFDFAAGNPLFRDISPTGRVPVLHHGALRVWESLSIMEYAAELFPDAGLWPEDVGDRAMARSISMEMLSGFRALRNACPMNIRREKGKIKLPQGVTDDVRRIEDIWRDMRRRSGGPFLFGRFSAADAMYAPVVSRFDVYDLVSSGDTLEYMAAVQAHPAWIAWREAAKVETWVVPEDEV